MPTNEPLVSTSYDFDAWCDVLSANDIPMQIECARRDTFRAEMRTKNLGGINFFDIRADAHRAVRTAALLTSDDTRVYGVTLQMEGTSSLTQDGQTSILQPGDFALYDSTREFERDFPEPYRCFIVRFPHSMMQLPSHTLSSVTATRFGANDGVGVVVSPFLAETANNLSELSGWTGVRVAHALIDLVSSALAEKLTDAQSASANPRAHAFVRLCEYIMQNLGDPTLSPDVIAHANFISTRQVHKIFHAERITVSQFIRDRRLEECRRQLGDPADAHLTVGQIAAQWGIYDGAHFSRIFRNAYGSSPREYRRSQLDTSVA
jgi:AraC-like DNA-binding protein